VFRTRFRYSRATDRGPFSQRILPCNPKPGGLTNIFSEFQIDIAPAVHRSRSDSQSAPRHRHHCGFTAVIRLNLMSPCINRHAPVNCVPFQHLHRLSCITEIYDNEGPSVCVYQTGSSPCSGPAPSAASPAPPVHVSTAVSTARSGARPPPLPAWALVASSHEFSHLNTGSAELWRICNVPRVITRWAP